MAESNSNYFCFNAINKSKVCQQILETYNKTSDNLESDVLSIKNWSRTQHHLPEVPSDQHITNFILLNKYRLDRVLAKIDMYYTVRSLMPEFYERTNPKLSHMKKHVDVVYCVPSQRLYKNQRLTFFKLADATVDNFDYAYMIANFCNILEVRMSEDYMCGEILIVDFDGLKMGHLSKITPMAVFKSMKIFERVFSNRVNSICFVNSSSVINTFVNLAKSVMKKKLAERIEMHSKSNVLTERFPKDLLPSDYGGTEKSLVELNELWKLKFEEYQWRFDQLDQLRVDESLRLEKMRNDDIFGCQGSFKQLDFD